MTFLVFFQEKVTIELIQILEEEERRWAQTLHIEDYQSHLARSVIQVYHHTLAIIYKFSQYMQSLPSVSAVIYAIQRLKVDLDRSTAVNQFLGARVARCSLTGLANFLYR